MIIKWSHPLTPWVTLLVLLRRRWDEWDLIFLISFPPIEDIHQDLLEKLWFCQTNHFPCNHIVLCYLLLICAIIATTITNNLKCIQYFIVDRWSVEPPKTMTKIGLTRELTTGQRDKWSLPPRKGIRTTWCGRGLIFCWQGSNGIGSSCSSLAIMRSCVSQPVKGIDGHWGMRS